MISMRSGTGLLWVALLLAGCAGTPEAIRQPPPDDPQLGAVRADPERYKDSEVRWGGHIVSVRNEKDQTILEVVHRRLQENGRPREEDQSAGRFLAKVQGFLDPAVYAANREVTMRGRVEDVIEQKIGEYRYRYPVIRAGFVHLWPPRPPPEPVRYYYDPYWPYPWGWPYPPPRPRPR
jgi:outer membrane lipoprotein